jgi:hypothetical protein
MLINKTKVKETIQDKREKAYKEVPIVYSSADLANTDTSYPDLEALLAEYEKVSGSTDDKLLRQVVSEIMDLSIKLDVIQYLKTMEKPIKHRIKVLDKFIESLRHTSTALNESGFTETMGIPLNNEEAEKLQQLLEVAQNNTTPEGISNINDFMS